MKKIFIVLIWTVVCQAQSNLQLSNNLFNLLGNNKLYTWEATNDTAIVGEGSALLNGLSVKTKATDKCSSSVKSPQKWMKYWGNLIEIYSSNFSAGTDGFESNVAGNIDYADSTDLLRISSPTENTFTSLTGSSLTGTGRDDVNQIRISFSYYNDDGLNTNIDITGFIEMTSPFDIQDIPITYQTWSSYDTTIAIIMQDGYDLSSIYLEIELAPSVFYIKNFNVEISFVDSSSGISTTLAMPEQTEYFWYHSLFYFTKGQTGVCAVDTFYSKADTDSFTTPTNRPTNFVAAGDTSHIDLTWGNASAIETGYAIERDTVVGGSGFVAIDTTAANATSYVDNGVVDGGTYRYRMRTIASTNSAYTDTESATVISNDEEFPEGVYITTPEGYYWTTSEGKYITGQLGD